MIPRLNQASLSFKGNQVGPRDTYKNKLAQNEKAAQLAESQLGITTNAARELFLKGVNGASAGKKLDLIA